ncbi:MAG TPA: NEW3 domain-containing protein [Jatrophihabitans sp.]|nr:NEW3 domain-containing protein [Jatrophihabitans sp.]
MSGKWTRSAGAAAATIALVVASLVAIGTVAAPRAQALDNGLALTPPMGWNGFTRFGRNVTAAMLENEAQAIVSSGMKDAGYQYVTLDGGWNLLQRGPDGQLVPDPAKFPDGIKPVVDYVHSLGLKFGIDASAGTTNCAGTSAGSYGHYQQDVDTFASWGVDFVKLEWCEVPLEDFPGQTIEQVATTLGQQFRDALAKSARPMVFDYNLNIDCPNNCEAWLWGASVANEWRTAPTTTNSWQNVLQNFTLNVPHYAYAGPGAWNDPGLLEIGNGALTPDEERTEFSLWAEMAAPLTAGNDPSTMTDATRDILTNRDVIAVDQDQLGAQGVPVSDSNGNWVLTKPLANGDRAVVLFNQNDSPATISTTVSQIGLPEGLSAYTLQDLWAHTTTETAGTISASLPPHGSVMYRVAPTNNPTAYPPQTALNVSPADDHLVAGASTTLTATLTDLGRLPLRRVDLDVQLPDGWTAEATSPTTFPTVPTGYTVTATWRATSSSPPTCAPLTLHATASYLWGARSTAGSTAASTSVVVSCRFTQAFDNVGITADTNRAPGNLDGQGNSYSEAALANVGVAPGGTISHAGLSFTWPDVPAGQPDNVAANGQLISLSGSGDTLAVIGSEDHAAFVPGTGTVYYTDGSTSPFTVQLGRWFQSDPGRIFQMPVYNSASADATLKHNVFVYYSAAPLDAGKTVAAVQLPTFGGPLGTGPKMHIFAISVGNAQLAVDSQGRK